MAEQSITLVPGESKVVSFEATPTVAKTYLVSVDGLTGSFKAIALLDMEVLEYYTTPRSCLAWTTDPNTGMNTWPAVDSHIDQVEVKLFEANTVPGSAIGAGRCLGGYPTQIVSYPFPLIRVRFRLVTGPSPGTWMFYPTIALPGFSYGNIQMGAYVDAELGACRVAYVFYGYGDLHKEVYCAEPAVLSQQGGVYFYRGFYITHRKIVDIGMGIKQYQVLPVGTYNLYIQGGLSAPPGASGEFLGVNTSGLIAQIRINKELPLW